MLYNARQLHQTKWLILLNSACLEHKIAFEKHDITPEWADFFKDSKVPLEGKKFAEHIYDFF